MLERGTQLVCRSDDWRDESGDSFRVERGSCLAIDQQPIATQHDGCFDTFALPNGSDELPNTGQLTLPTKSDREARDRKCRSQALIIA